MKRNEMITHINALRRQHAQRSHINCKTAKQREYLKRTQKILLQEIEAAMEEHDITLRDLEAAAQREFYSQSNGMMMGAVHMDSNRSTK